LTFDTNSATDRQTNCFHMTLSTVERISSFAFFNICFNDHAQTEWTKSNQKSTDFIHDEVII
jgi:hypothetical protein